MTIVFNNAKKSQHSNQRRPQAGAQPTQVLGIPVEAETIPAGILSPEMIGSEEISGFSNPVNQANEEERLAAEEKALAEAEEFRKAQLTELDAASADLTEEDPEFAEELDAMADDQEQE